MGSLHRYLEMRDFAQTPEPDGGTASGHLAPRYSIQKHDATRTHFDLRLEWKGVLLSWAITKGPSFDPGEKRLAVRTEDHPLDYLTFEGTIPKDNYGAGTAMLWDLGHWQPLIPVGKALKKGHLHLRLHGARLTGEWHLIRMKTEGKRENWLLTKAEDAASGARDPVARYRRSVLSQRTTREIAADKPPVETQAGKRPGFSKPQLATLSDKMVAGDGWWHELKFDGYRALIALGKGGPRVFTRNGKDWTDRFEGLLPALAEVDCDSALIDGEIVAGAGLDGFSELQKAITAGGPFRFYGFDILSRDGNDLRKAPLAERRKALEEVMKPLPALGPAQLSPVISKDPEDAFDTICKAGGEGLIAKRIDTPYRGARSKSWMKVKCERRDEFVILGWQESDKRGRPFASLALGAVEGNDWRYVGKVGTGFDEDQAEALAKAMKPLARKTAPADVEASEAKGIHWITPELVAEIRYAERTGGDRLRHAVFLGLREDKPARTVRLDNDVASEERPNVAGIGISSPDRVVFEGAGYTKVDVARYYEAMAYRILPHLAEHPVSLLRLPEGLGGERFFQKHAGRGFPDGIESVEITESDGKTAQYMMIRTAEGLVAAAQMGTIEFHIWGSRVDPLDRPDRLVFDLDPDEGLDFAAVRDAAFEIRDLLAELDMPNWPLLSGGNGIHVTVPLRRSAGWDTVRLFARVFSRLLVARSPKRYTAEMSKAKRKGRIFVDWLRNGKGATAIAPYSLRARFGAPVAMPVSWDELKKIRKPNAFDLGAALERDEGIAFPDAVSISQGRVDKLEDMLEGSE
ncbi:DNA ligase D [Thioclava sp. JE_KL1]|uniref:DNA ligase D n=1 Tax=Thioclava sp. JE_KL1 TaxID=2651187 RepID=UPI00128B1972|nr:DNA ligase D [Thioclava sp. JE_KL1]MPQ94929.1 DNA ligase D [Thioclava sp. JE_KL1]